MKDERMSLTKHHLWWPKSYYTTPLEKKFRELPCNIVLLPCAVHEALHFNTMLTPNKPTAVFMQDVVDYYATHHNGG